MWMASKSCAGPCYRSGEGDDGQTGELHWSIGVMRTKKHMENLVETHIERLNKLCHHCGKTFETRNYGTRTLIKLGVGGLLCENVNQ